MNNRPYMYFRCPRKNLWEEFRNEFQVEEEPPCNFYKRYDNDRHLQNEYYKKRQEWDRRDKINEFFQTNGCLI